MTKSHALLTFFPAWALLAAVALSGCAHHSADHSARDEFKRKLEFCTVAENNGLIESALNGCRAALAIVEQQGYAAEMLSPLLYRLGRMERQQSHFAEAKQLMQRSLRLEEQSGQPTAIALRLIELSLCEAGQGRWAEGAAHLERASPHFDKLDGADRKAALGALQLFSVRLRGVGQAEMADRFQSRLDSL
jgi:tetratricopeptide (TPR) repeat protein